MSNWLKLTSDEKKEVFNATAAPLGLPPFVVEKDWWVTLCLREVFSMEAAPNLLFKGGTSLSKAWGIIERFSEDIDLAIDRDFLGFEEVKSRTQVSKLRKATQSFVSGPFTTELKKRLEPYNVNIQPQTTTGSDQDPFKIFIEYPNLIPHTEYVRPTVTLEVGGRSLREPFTDREIHSFVDTQFPERTFASPSFRVPTVNVERTFLEKLFLLHEEFQRPPAKIRVERLSRHLYDIYKIIQTPFAESAIKDTELYKAIVEHRAIFSKMEGVDYSSHYPPNLYPIPPDDLLKPWETDYKTMQSEMIQGDSPPFGKLISEIRVLVEKINKS